MESKTRKDIEFGERAGSFVRNQGGNGWTGYIENLQKTPLRMVLWSLVLALIVAMIVSAATGKAVIKKYAIGLVILIGLAFLADRIIYANLGNQISNKFSGIGTSSASASTLTGPKAGDVFAYDVTPDKWTDVQLPQWADIDIARPGRLEYLFPNGKRIIAEDGKPASLGRLPSRNFKIRGTAGKVTFTIQ